MKGAFERWVDQLLGIFILIIKVLLLAFLFVVVSVVVIACVGVDIDELIDADAAAVIVED